MAIADHQDAHPRQLRRPARRDRSGPRCSAGRSRTRRTSTRCSPARAAWPSASAPLDDHAATGVAQRARQQAVPPRPRRRRPRRARPRRASSSAPRSPTSSRARPGASCSTRAATRSASPRPPTGAEPGRRWLAGEGYATVRSPPDNAAVVGRSNRGMHVAHGSTVPRVPRPRRPRGCRWRGLAGGVGRRRGPHGDGRRVLINPAASGGAPVGSSGSGVGAATASTGPRDGPRRRPTDLPASIAGPMTGGKGTFLGRGDRSRPGPRTRPATARTSTPPSGTAPSTRPPAACPPTAASRSSPGPTADYVTRIVVRRPAGPDAFNGTVVVEWLNVSAGVDAAPDYTYLADELLRQGYAWVGVSAQRIGVEGGPVAVQAPGAEGRAPARASRPSTRRATALHHPGDAYSYDIFTQVARAAARPGGTIPLDGLAVEQVLAVGESQSAFALTTYYDGVQPLDPRVRRLPGPQPRRRGRAARARPSGGIDIAGSLGGKPTRSAPTRTRRRSWSRPRPTCSASSATSRPASPTPTTSGCGRSPAPPTPTRSRSAPARPTSAAPRRSTAASRSSCCAPRCATSTTWVAGGPAPPHGDPLEVDTSGREPTYVLDAVGNVKGGVRTPAVDAPVDVLSGLAPERLRRSSASCSARPRRSRRRTLAALYPSADAYLEAVHARPPTPPSRPASPCRTTARPCWTTPILPASPADPARRRRRVTSSGDVTVSRTRPRSAITRARAAGGARASAGRTPDAHRR